MTGMALKTATTKTGWPVPAKVKDDFVEFCSRVSSHAQADCAGALLLWQYMPSAVREWAKLAAKGDSDFSEAFWQEFGVRIEAMVLIPVGGVWPDTHSVDAAHAALQAAAAPPAKPRESTPPGRASGTGPS